MDFDELKETLRQRCDIVDVIGGYVPLKRAGANHKACCPFHNEKTPSFMVNGAKQMFHCFGCHKGGDVFAFVMEHEGVDFLGAMRILARHAGLPFDEDELRRRGQREAGPAAAAARTQKDLLLELHERIATWFQANLRSPVGQVAMDYVRQRGLTDDELVHWGLGYAPEGWDHALRWGQAAGYTPALMREGGLLTVKDEDDPRARPYDRFRHRLMFPIWNPQGRIVGFSGRALVSDHGGAKYINTPETPIFHKGSLLYALPYARKGIKDLGYAMLCEGQLDVIACHSAGLTNAVAPQGTAFTEEQARLLKRHTDQLLLAFDADAAGIKAALRSAEIFIPADLTAKVVLMDQGEDPDSLVRKQGPEALRAKVAQARDYFDFLLDQLAQQHDARTPQGSAAISAAFLDPVSRLGSPVLRAEYCQHLAHRLGVPESYVFQELKAVQNRRLRTRLQQERRAPPPAPAAPPRHDEAARLEKAEAILLDIALHHEPYARRLEQELPHDYLTISPLGEALGRVLGLTLEGEWGDAEAALRDWLAEQPAAAVSQVLMTPEFGPGHDPRKLALAFEDCLACLVDAQLRRELDDLQAKLRTALQRDEQVVLLERIQAIQKQRARRRTPAD
jgi:DNA primase